MGAAGSKPAQRLTQLSETVNSTLNDWKAAAQKGKSLTERMDSAVSGIFQSYDKAHDGRGDKSEGMRKFGANLQGSNESGSIGNKVGAALQAAGGNPIPIMMEQFKQFQGGVKQMGNAFDIKNESPTAAAGNLLGGAGNALEGAYGPGLVSSTLKFAGALADSVDKIRSWSHTLYEADMKFAEFSASLSAVKQITDVRTMLREMQQGERRAGATGRLANSMSNFEDAMAPITDDMTIIKDTVIAKLLPLAQLILDSGVIQGVLGFIKMIVGADAEKGNDNGLTTEAAYVANRAMEHLVKQVRDSRPPRHR